MEGLKFDKLTINVKITALANITRYVRQALESEGITKETVPEDFFNKINDHKVSKAMVQFRFTDDGKIIEESTKVFKGVLDYGREQYPQ